MSFVVFTQVVCIWKQCFLRSLRYLQISYFLRDVHVPSTSGDITGWLPEGPLRNAWCFCKDRFRWRRKSRVKYHYGVIILCFKKRTLTATHPAPFVATGVSTGRWRSEIGNVSASRFYHLPSKVCLLFFFFLVTFCYAIINAGLTE